MPETVLVLPASMYHVDLYLDCLRSLTVAAIPYACISLTMLHDKCILISGLPFLPVTAAL